MAEEIILVEHIQAVASKVNTAMQAKGFGYTVKFMYGHPREIDQRLTEITNDPNTAGEKFPIIMLFTDITIRKSVTGFYGSANLFFLIANFTQAQYTAMQRTDINFKPILHPIKKELIYQLSVYPLFTVDEEITYEETDLYFYGSKVNDKNQFRDRIDAIQLSNVSINITEQTNCVITSNL